MDIDEDSFVVNQVHENLDKEDYSKDDALNLIIRIPEKINVFDESACSSD